MSCACTCLRARAHSWHARVLAKHLHATPRPHEFACDDGGGATDAAHAWPSDAQGEPFYGAGDEGFLSGAPYAPWFWGRAGHALHAETQTPPPIGKAIPEPATWTLGLIGALAIGGASHRLQRKARRATTSAGKGESMSGRLLAVLAIAAAALIALTPQPMGGLGLLDRWLLP